MLALWVRRSSAYEKDAIDWKIPSGMARLEVKEILYQPEAAGDFDS